MRTFPQDMPGTGHVIVLTHTPPGKGILAIRRVPAEQGHDFYIAGALTDLISPGPVQMA